MEGTLMVSSFVRTHPISYLRRTPSCRHQVGCTCFETVLSMKHGVYLILTHRNNVLIGALRGSLRKPFSPPTITLKEVHAAVPKHLLRRSPLKSCLYIARDLVLTAIFLAFASYIPAMACAISGILSWPTFPIAATFWGAYWWLQGLLWAGIFCLGGRIASLVYVLSLTICDGQVTT
jgi:hypothetical protein